ncbi:hypothetical protein H0H87_010518, partial [Tephrocybe sp. NHM501043]
MDHKSFETGSHRSKFFQSVVEGAETLHSLEHKETMRRVLSALDSLTGKLDQLQSSNDSKDVPTLFLSFDECHSLLEPLDNSRGTSLYVELRRVLADLKQSSVFAFFLSTTGRISEYTPSHAVDTNDRIMEGINTVIPPFSDLGFDQLMVSRKVTKRHTLNEVTNLAFMANYGRPMFGLRLQHTNDVGEVIAFAAHKLLGPGENRVFGSEQQLACLSRRVPIDFYSTVAARKQEELQVEGHLRVCLHVHPGFEAMVTVAPSEPLLSEAAARLM